MDLPYVILPEEQAPNGIEHCEFCELSKQRNRVIWGEGNRSLCGTRETLQFGMSPSSTAAALSEAAGMSYRVYPSTSPITRLQ